MPPTSRVRLFVDADVLASPVPRTILYLAQPLSDYELVYSPLVETEAERHQRTGHVPVSTLRRRWEWKLVANADDTGHLTDTNDKDRPILAAAIAAASAFVVTGNVRHFGPTDLDVHNVSAVHPGLFLAHHLTADSYQEILDAVAVNRAREPRDPLSIHEQEIALHLPPLFERHRNLFGASTPAVSHRPPTVLFRGPRCVRCARRSENLAIRTGLCDDCRPTIDP